jgi:uncharacterized repeat protein (TIGR03803 family)
MQATVPARMLLNGHRAGDAHAPSRTMSTDAGFFIDGTVGELRHGCKTQFGCGGRDTLKNWRNRRKARGEIGCNTMAGASRLSIPWNATCFVQSGFMAVGSDICRKHASRLAGPVSLASVCLCFILLVISGFGSSAGAFTFQEIASFTNVPVGPAAPANPAGGLIQGTDGNFYGTSFAGGNFGLGTVFQMTPAGVVMVLTSFNGTNGANPRGTMVTDNAGNFYGVTYGGGQANAGTVFKISMSGNLTVLHDFYADPGQNPYAGLFASTDGNFYGTTESYGMVFKITPSGVFSNLSTCFGLNGESLNSVLVQGPDGYLYGAAGLKAFSAQGGMIFKLSTNGGMATIVSQFTGTNGDKPFGGLTAWPSGGLFAGEVVSGGSYEMGATIGGTNNGTQFSKTFDFTGINGAYPYAPVAPDVFGNLDGGTAAGGTYGQGAIYQLNACGLLLVLASLDGTNGSGVYGQLAQGMDGYIYGTTRFGGGYGHGTVFKMDISGDLSLLTSFPPPFVAQPDFAGIIQGSNGNFYGLSTQAGPGGSAGIFQLAPGGVLSTFASFTNSPGAAFDSSLLAANDGNFYVTTLNGGTYNDGAVIQIAPDGSSTTIFSFNNTDGANPFAGVIQGTDDLLYGTTVNGGSGYGTVFSLGTDGTLNMSADFLGTNGANPYAPLIQGQDGSFYGTTYAGGASNLGTVFSVASDGTLSNLYSFSGVDGANPSGGLVQGGDGFLYGTTANGGLTNGSSNSAGYGTVFQISTNGSTFNTLVYFNGTNGANPHGSLIAGPDGNFYGTTLAGGASNAGTVFSVTGGGVLTTIYSFSGTDGSGPYAGLFFGSDGALYGETMTGGSAGGGNIFRIAQPAMLQLNMAAGLIQVAWPAFDAEFQLESSSNLSDPNGWSPVTDTPGTNGNQVMVLEPAPTNSIFYRLIKP